ncbi:MAG: hypothetical protein JWN13_5807, partial [Betaproteobacteria bacterium]|nr:hypothetical protein [Betaproteobacteria bacterium]
MRTDVPGSTAIIRFSPPKVTHDEHRHYSGHRPSDIQRGL